MRPAPRRWRRAPGRPLVVLTPRGRPLDQAMVRGFAAAPGVVLLCGRFEGIDQRVIEARAMIEVSIGDYVLSGGEPAALVLLDACVRLLPGVMGAAESGEEESFSSGLLEYPHYTRPTVWNGRAVPPVLLSGHHAEIARWRRAQAETHHPRAPPRALGAIRRGQPHRCFARAACRPARRRLNQDTKRTKP